MERLLEFKFRWNVSNNWGRVVFYAELSVECYPKLKDRFIIIFFLFTRTYNAYIHNIWYWAVDSPLLNDLAQVCLMKAKGNLVSLLAFFFLSGMRASCRLLFWLVKNILDALPLISRCLLMARSGILISITKWLPSCPPYHEEISFFYQASGIPTSATWMRFS